MVTLKEACFKVMSEQPDMYITAVNDCGDIYEFILMFKGEKWTYWTNPFMIPRATVNKQTGKYEKTDLDTETNTRGELYDENTIHYSQEEIEKLLSETD